MANLADPSLPIGVVQTERPLQQVVPDFGDLATKWAKDATDHYRATMKLIEGGNFRDAQSEIALGEETFLHASLLRLRMAPGGVTE